MKRCFKFMIVLLALFLVSGCNNNESIYNAKMVSSYGTSSYVISKENDDILKANVMIFNNRYSSFLGIKYKENNSYGSGVIYKKDQNYYYVLTNNHVISYDYSYSVQKIVVEDFYSNRYEGTVIYSNISYDLAIVRFESKENLEVLNISGNGSEIRESVRSMGNPNSIKNVITSGMINCYSYVSLNNSKSKIDFEVIVHSANIYSGSSGGALLNENNEIIGITFAGVFDNKGNFITGYAIPVEKIREFINMSK